MTEPEKKRGRKGSKKTSGGIHKVPRRMVGIPLPWFELAQKMARKKPTPTVWYLVDLIRREADAMGEPIPPLPWETESR